MTTLLNAAKQALEALVCLEEDGSYLAKNAASALRTAIQEAEQQEPVAWFDPDSGLPFGWTEEPPTPGAIFLYTTPQPPAAKEWQGLTDEDIDVLKQLTNWSATGTLTSFARSIEQRLKELNT